MGLRHGADQAGPYAVGGWRFAGPAPVPVQLAGVNLVPLPLAQSYVTDPSCLRLWTLATLHVPARTC